MSYANYPQGGGGYRANGYPQMTQTSGYPAAQEGYAQEHRPQQHYQPPRQYQSQPGQYGSQHDLHQPQHYGNTYIDEHFDYFANESDDRGGLVEHQAPEPVSAYPPSPERSPLQHNPMQRYQSEHRIDMDYEKRQRQNSQKARNRQSIRHVELVNGNLVLDCRVPEKVLRNVNYTSGEEFTHMRYTAVTCDPDDFVKERYTLRPRLMGRQTELFIVMTMYNEDDELFLKTMNAVIKNVAHLCSRTRSKTWSQDGWQKIVACIVSDGRNKIHPRVLKVLGAMGVYQDGIAKSEVAGNPVTAHLFEYTTQTMLDSHMQLHGTDKCPVPVQVLFCLKEQNKKKLNSHRWFFNAFAPLLNPNVCILLDVGTKPSSTSIYHLWKAFDRNPHVGGACGEICAELGSGWNNLMNPLVASQNFEYKMSNILDKPLESVFGYISVLPGAFSAYRYKALQDSAPGVGPLASYFKGEMLHGSSADANIFEANMYLAEDRILCFELVAKRNESWLLKYVKSAKAETDVPDNLPEFISQRRRWLNGSFFAAVYGTAHFFRIYGSGHNPLRKLLLTFEFLYNGINLFFNWFALGNFYLAFFFLGNASTPSLVCKEDACVKLSREGIPDPFFGRGEDIFPFARNLYIMVIVIIFISAMGNRPQGSKWLYRICVVLFAIIMGIMLYISGFAIWKTVSTAGGIKDIPNLVKTQPIFRDMIISLGSTYLLYFVSSFLHMEPWHMFTSFIQYLFLMPSYINILMVYAFCNTHDVSWGTKGDNGAASLGAAQVTKMENGKQVVKVEVPTEQHDINQAYEEMLKELAVPEVKEKQKRDAKTKQEDYYKLFRTNLVLSWAFSNALLIIIMTSSRVNEFISHKNPDASKTYNPYLTFIFWSVAFLSAVRFVGCVSYLILRLIFGG
ncbi:uncharacterized protein VTP21DRAFT_3866 [Calcarisporiella thermophila]|uniref:uncharacterized protein n=1 Tax=Calcarisporiella thermophila TaxID=911321 RepID=UPI0037441025